MYNLSINEIENIRLLRKEKVSIKNIAKQYNVSTTFIGKIIRENNIEGKHKSYRLNLPLSVIDDYMSDKESIISLSKKYKCGQGSIKRFLKKNNISIRNIAQQVTKGRLLIIEERDGIEKLYKEGWSIQGIGRHYGIPNPTIRMYFIRNKIPYVTRKEMLKDPNYYEKIKKWMKWCKEYKLPSGKIIKVQGYEDKFLKYIFENKLLEENEIDYNHKFIPYNENGVNRKYFPDFYIPKLNLIVEIKSSWVLRNDQPVRNLKAKEIGVKNAGYSFLMVLDNDFNELNSKLSIKRS